MTDPISTSTRREYAGEDCDEATGVCGAMPKPDTQVSRTTCDVDDPPAPCLPQDFAGVSARELAVNAAKKASLPERTTLDSMTWTELRHEAIEVRARLEAAPEYVGRGGDLKRLAALEGESDRRTGFIRSSLDGQLTGDADQLYAYQTSEPDLAEQSAGLSHAVASGDVGATHVTVSVDHGTAKESIGTRNSDGSTGLHVVASATLVGAEATASEGRSSGTVGIGVGVGVDLSVGMREGALCYRFGGVGLELISFGGCMAPPGEEP